MGAFQSSKDWTAGCIALTDEEIEELCGSHRTDDNRDSPISQFDLRAFGLSMYSLSLQNHYRWDISFRNNS